MVAQVNYELNAPQSLMAGSDPVVGTIVYAVPAQPQKML